MSTTQTCPWTTGGDEHGVGALRCDREATYECKHATDSCTVHKSSCCTPKLEPLVMERLREMSRYARVAFFARITADYCQLCGDEGAERCTGQCADRSRSDVECIGSYVDFQGADRTCLPGGEGCGLTGCVAAHAPTGGW